MIPPAAKLLTGLVLALALVGGGFFFADEARIHGGGALTQSWLAAAWPGLALGSCLAAFILALGYVYGDARRRGMRAALWTLASAFVPNLIGFLLFFLMRKPLLAPCASCGHGVEPGQTFCPACGQPARSEPALQAASVR